MDAVGLAADAAFWSTFAMTVKVVSGVAKDAGLGKVSRRLGGAWRRLE